MGSFVPCMLNARASVEPDLSVKYTVYSIITKYMTYLCGNLYIARKKLLKILELLMFNYHQADLYMSTKSIKS